MATSRSFTSVLHLTATLFLMCSFNLVAQNNTSTIVLPFEGSVSVNQLVTIDPSNGKAELPTSSLTNIVGSVTQISGSNAMIAVAGLASCIADGPFTAYDYVGSSSAHPGKCIDLGANLALINNSSTVVLGQALNSSSPISILLRGPGLYAPETNTVTPWTTRPVFDVTNPAFGAVNQEYIATGATCSPGSSNVNFTGPVTPASGWLVHIKNCAWETTTGSSGQLVDLAGIVTGVSGSMVTLSNPVSCTATGASKCPTSTTAFYAPDDTNAIQAALYAATGVQSNSYGHGVPEYFSRRAFTTSLAC